jgi:hypothetical protein
MPIPTVVTLTHAKPSRTLDVPDNQTTVFAAPSAGDTLRVEYSFDGVVFNPWASGDVTAYTAMALDSNIANVRFTRIAGSSETSYGGTV